MRPGRAGGLARISAILVVISLGAKLLGFVREVIIADLFGASRETDALFLVFALWFQVAITLMLETVKVMVPRLLARTAAGDKRGHDRLVWSTSGVYLAVFGLIAAGAGWFAPALSVAVGAELEPVHQALIASMLRAALPVLPLAGIAGVLMAVANARGDFVLVEMGTLGLNLGIVVALVVWGSTLGVMSGAIGMTIGAVLLLLFTLAYCLRARVPGLAPPSEPREGARIFFFSSLLGTLGPGGGYPYAWATRYFFLLMAGGTLAAMTYASRLLTLPVQIVAPAIVKAILPTMASAAAAGNADEARRLANRGLRVLLAMIVPIAVLMAGVSGNLVRVVFGRGAFGEDDVLLTAAMLVRLAPATVLGMTRNVVASTLIAFDRVWLPNAAGIVVVVVFCALAPVVLPRWGAYGLALLQGLADGLSCWFVLWLARRTIGLRLPKLGSLVLRLVFASALPAALGFFGAPVVDGWTAPLGRLAPVVSLMIAGGLSGAAFLGLAYLLRIEEAREAWRIVLARFRPAAEAAP